ncbi:uncharacterized protein LOC117760269 isoform X1 [Hippoglossus hippoglossus]|uniref:uncharacterized protein LOC117760269 isoform X1 n=2 Tax=Hippoglossus hippoglossus TaxID=8267 RepID=UPI00148E861A|nr:uncharacterized protein LOC117760269 isoform X1 [Hippoglossus hippoglossus]
MPSHIMLSYQWDDQALVKKIYNRLKEDGLPVWMDVEGGVTGNINDAMAAGVEEAVVICPFMTPEYQASRSCKKELNYADTREVIVVPVMLTKNWEASEWLGLITAGLLWVDFRNAEKDEELFEMCLRSLEEEIMFNVGHLLAVEEAPREEEEDEPEPPKPCLKKKPGRGFRHAVSELYIHDSGEQMIPTTTESRNTVELSEAAGDHRYWEEMKGNGCKFYRNVVTNRFLGFDWSRNQVHSEVSPSESEEWLLLVDQTDQSHKRAVIIKNKRSGSFLAVRDGHFLGLTSYDEDCKWFLE